MSIKRSASPTTALWEAREQARGKMATMAQMGLHVFDPAWQSWDDAPRGKMYSPSFKEATLQIFGKDDKLFFPVQTCTKVRDLREALSRALMVDPGSMDFIVKQGCNSRRQYDTEEVARRTIVKGITAFKPQPHKWPHPIGIIGTGYQGLKTAFLYLSAGDTNFTMFDRHDKVGGYCWIDAANKTSKIQTELGSFHVWGGQEIYKTCGHPNPEDWGGIWPYKEQILRHFQHAAEQFGVLPHINFSCNVAKMDIEGDRNAQDRFYKCTVMPVSGEGEGKTVNVSVIFNYPGSMTRNRLIEYPGEDVFGGIIGYGMNDETPYHMLKGSCTAVLGNGAFAVENIRTCCEYQAEKCYLLTRRKNLASPRMPCWFAHQGPAPTPARMILKMFEPMYNLVGFGDPWEFWSVHASGDRKHVTIIQNSRFGIGDVTFLACVYGKCEFVEDTLKRLTRHTLHLTGGRKLANVTVLNKSLGLLGDYAVDRLHGMQKMAGAFCEGDWRRVLMIDATGMNAANFTTFSTGIGTTGFVRMYKYFHDFPKEFYRLQGMGLMDQLPVNKANPKEDKPAYVTDVKMAMSASIIIESMCPKIGTLGASDPDYKYRMYHNCHPLQKTLDECTASWDAYQAEWKKNGSTHDYVPYPYTKEMMEGYFQEYSAHVGFPVSPYGPPEGSQAPELPGHTDLSAIPAWATDASAVGQAEMQAQGGNLSWWEGSAPWCEVNKGKKKTHAGH